MKLKIACGCLLLAFLAAFTDELTELKKNIGKNACNKQNGAYRGKILDVMRDPINNSGILVYKVQRKGSRAVYAPVDNTTVVAGKCPDGEPKQ